MNDLSVVIGVLYWASMLTLAVFGLHRFFLIHLYRKHRNARTSPPLRFRRLPMVTIQLPIYNEKYVVRRLLDAVVRLDYPAELLEIQVLDDSTDETTAIIAAHLARMQTAIDIRHVRRPERTGFKAGALQYGLGLCRGEFVAIFDADFVPAPDFLKRTIHYFTDPKVGMVQTRWGHINGNYSLFARLQAIFLDGHFAVEHSARYRSGRFFNFNGTAGIWRKKAIELAGGWRSGTLTEDLDLSYRAQLAGWRFVYVEHVESPAELPVDMNSFKTQQHRWAKGSIQTARQVLPVVWKSSLPWKVKVEAVLHLTENLCFLLMLFSALLIPPAMLTIFKMKGWVLFLAYSFLFVAGTISLWYYYLYGQKQIRGDWKSSIKYMPFLMSLGIGMSVNNARAVLEALFGRDSPFLRTPKYDICGRNQDFKHKEYRPRTDFGVIIEILLGIYFAASMVLAVKEKMFATIPFLLLLQSGFLWVAYLSLAHARAK